MTKTGKEGDTKTADSTQLFEGRAQILERAIDGHVRGVPHVMSFAAMFVPTLFIIAVLEHPFGLIIGVVWMLAILIRLAYLHPTGAWVDYTPNNFAFFSWMRFYRGLLGIHGG